MKLLLPAFLLALLVSCATGAPPNAFERAAYHVTTNYQTQAVQIVQLNTNNLATNFVWVTNISERYQFDPKPEVVTAIQTAGTVATTFGFGVGGIIASILLGAYGAWAKWQSNRRGALNGVLTNNVQVARETILATAGAATEAQFVDAIKSAQVKAGVKDDAADVKDSKVDEKEAREEAASVVLMAKKVQPVKRTPAP